MDRGTCYYQGRAGAESPSPKLGVGDIHRENAIFDSLFRELDTKNKGYIDGISPIFQLLSDYAYCRHPSGQVLC